MADEFDNLVLEHLRAIRGGIHELKTYQGNLVRRMDTLQSEMALMHRKFSDVATELGQVTERLDRIERRLHLVDSPAS